MDKKIGIWRLSNHRFTIRVDVDADCKIVSTAPVAGRFVGKRFEELCCWMQRISATDIMLLGTKGARQVSTDSQEAC